jgi:hypothetical protein
MAMLLATVACAPPSGPPDRSDAISICERYVRDGLQSPSTASFSSRDAAAFDSENGARWQVKGWVDSQNGAGAMIRSDYDCTVHFQGRSGGNIIWTRENVSVKPR